MRDDDDFRCMDCERILDYNDGALCGFCEKRRDDARKARQSVGLPYAMAEFDDAGYHVVCPECFVRCRSEVGASEDDITKGANRVYALHYAAAHRNGDPR